MVVIGSLIYFFYIGVFFLLSVKKPHFVIVPYLCMYVLKIWGVLYLSSLYGNQAVTNIFILSLLIVAVILSKKKVISKIDFSGIRIRLFSAILIIYAFVSTLWAPMDVIGWEYWATRWQYMFASIILVPLVIDSVASLRFAQKQLIYFGGTLLLFFAVLVDWKLRGVVIPGTTETITLPLTMAQLSGYVLVCGAVYFSKKPINIIFLGIVIAAALIVSVKSASRGPLIFSIVTVAIIAPMLWKNLGVANILKLIVIMVIFSFSAYYIFQLVGEQTDRWTAEEISGDAYARFDTAIILLSKWLESPMSILFGLGNSASFSSTTIGVYPHIVPLEILGEEGLVGFILYGLIAYYVVNSLITVVKRKNLTPMERKVLMANFGCWVFSMLLSLKQGSLVGSDFIFLFAAIHERIIVLINSKDNVQLPEGNIEPNVGFKKILRRKGERL